MKRLFVLAMLICVFLVGCAPAAQGFVELPGDVKAGITAFLLVVVSWIFARLIVLVPFLKFLEQFREPLALAISVELINLIQNAVPDAFGAVAVLALQLILAVLALYMTFFKLRDMGVKGFK